MLSSYSWEGEADIASGVHFFSNSRGDLTVGQMGFEKSEVQQVIWNLSFPFLAGHLFS